MKLGCQLPHMVKMQIIFVDHILFVKNMYKIYATQMWEMNYTFLNCGKCQRLMTTVHSNQYSNFKLKVGMWSEQWRTYYRAKIHR